MGPEPSVIVGHLSEPGLGHGLTREPGGEHVDRRDGGPVDGGEVPEVGDTGPTVGEDGAGVRVDFGLP